MLPYVTHIWYYHNFYNFCLWDLLLRKIWIWYLAYVVLGLGLAYYVFILYVENMTFVKKNPIAYVSYVTTYYYMYTNLMTVYFTLYLSR